MVEAVGAGDQRGARFVLTGLVRKLLEVALRNIRRHRGNDVDATPKMRGHTGKAGSHVHAGIVTDIASGVSQRHRVGVGEVNRSPGNAVVHHGGDGCDTAKRLQ